MFKELTFEHVDGSVTLVFISNIKLSPSKRKKLSIILMTENVTSAEEHPEISPPGHQVSPLLNITF